MKTQRGMTHLLCGGAFVAGLLLMLEVVIKPIAHPALGAYLVVLSVLAWREK